MDDRIKEPDRPTVKYIRKRLETAVEKCEGVKP